MCHASERDESPVSGGPVVPNHCTASPHHVAWASSAWRWRRARRRPAKRSRSANRALRPVDPRDRVVLVVGVVVAVLGASELVAHRHHRRAQRHRQQAPGVAQLAAAQGEDLCRRAVVAFEPAVPGAVVAGAVAVGVRWLRCACGRRRRGRTSEPVVAGEEVDSLGGALEEVGTAADALDQRSGQSPSPRRKPRTSSR